MRFTAAFVACALTAALAVPLSATVPSADVHENASSLGIRDIVEALDGRDQELIPLRKRTGPGESTNGKPAAKKKPKFTKTMPTGIVRNARGNNGREVPKAPEGYIPTPPQANNRLGINQYTRKPVSEDPVPPVVAHHPPANQPVYRPQYLQSYPTGPPASFGEAVARKTGKDFKESLL
ncbi:hypothetical protein EIP91_010439 [Steccherinum ochraceum]|uniref:Uncharacterized protein n=1 Tax=Steccherinum ochraceum TaxID=92696 RepID=A0A4R0R5X3_9APHY|nr:hypothetical protein EIP91_010439 [Steccherinum ochraceum]